MRGFVRAVLGAAGLVALSAPAWADDSPASAAEIDALRRRVEQQERKLAELEGRSLTADEVSAAVDRYVARTPAPAVLVGGGADGGSAGWPMGGAPFIKEGPNKIAFHFRNQVRYSWFHYSDDAKGLLASPPNTLSDDAPRDRSGFELERLYFGIDGSIFCPDITFNLVLNFDSDSGSGVEKEFAWIDWKYSGEHHVRAGTDKVPFTYEEQNSSGALAFVDRSLYTKAFALDSDTGVMLWGNFGSCDCPKQWLYKLFASTGEGRPDQAGSVFNTDAFDTYSDQLLFSGCLEYTFTCKDWKFDEVDHRACEERCCLEASLGICGYYEDDDDSSERSPGGLALRSSGRLERWGAGAWFRARYNGWTLIAEAGMRHVDYTAGSTAPNQVDYGAELTVHYRFADSNWGIGAKGGVIWLDDDYDTLTAGSSTVSIEDTITEAGVVLNYFFHDHSNKISADVTWVQDNSGVNSSSAGYMFGASRGVLVEDGLYFRLQWQLNF
jgi:hypothetical protein